MPLQKLELYMRIVDQVVELDTKKNATHWFQNRLSPIIQYKKAEKFSKRHRISLNQAAQLLQARQRRNERKYLMSGGRSLGSSLRTSLENLANTSNGRSSIDTSIPDSFSLTETEVERCIKEVGAEIRRSQYSDSTSSPLLSSRPSAANSGSLRHQSSSLYKEYGSKHRRDLVTSALQTIISYQLREPAQSASRSER
jgi:hypothetical protein